MKEKDFQEHFNNSVEPELKMYSEHYGVEYEGRVANLCARAYSEGINKAYTDATREFIDKDTHVQMHHIAEELIIEAIQKLGKKTIRIKNGPYIQGVHVRQSVDGKPFVTGAFVRKIKINGESIVCVCDDEGSECFIMQNELTFADLLRIYRYIPFKPESDFEGD